jgi:hypothetical protein
MVKALKSFRIYILHSKIIAYVPSSIVKEIMSHPDSDGRREMVNRKNEGNRLSDLEMG